MKIASSSDVLQVLEKHMETATHLTFYLHLVKGLESIKALPGSTDKISLDDVDLVIKTVETEIELAAKKLGLPANSTDPGLVRMVYLVYLTSGEEESALGKIASFGGWNRN